MAGKGSPKGVRQGGRKTGTPNRANTERQAAIAASGITPLEYMLGVMRDESVDDKRRDAMAARAASACATSAFPTAT